MTSGNTTIPAWNFAGVLPPIHRLICYKTLLIGILPLKLPMQLPPVRAEPVEAQAGEEQILKGRGAVQPYLERLHQQFTRDFVESLPTWPGKHVGLKRHPEYDGKSATFWHMISEGSDETERTPDLRRCERIAWPRPVIDAFDEVPPGTMPARIIWWQEIRGSEQKEHRS
jgi:hypothetical protein